MTPRAARMLGLVVTCLAALAACGDGEEGNAGSPTCAGMCRVYAEAGCADFDEGNCIDGCAELAGLGRDCAAEYRRIIGCVVRLPAETVVCADGQPVVTGTDCSQEFYDHTQCLRLTGGDAGAGGSGAQSGVGGRTAATLCSTECPFSGDGACDDGGPGASFGDCTYGTDCQDCGPRVWTGAGDPICGNDCGYRADGECDDGGPGSQYDVCVLGTDCADCGPRESTTEGSGGGGGNPSVPVDWRCVADYYGSADGCDCGCGVADPDCAGLGCTTPGCRASGCQFCYTADGASNPCG